MSGPCLCALHRPAPRLNRLGCTGCTVHIVRYSHRQRAMQAGRCQGTRGFGAPTARLQRTGFLLQVVLASSSTTWIRIIFVRKNHLPERKKKEELSTR